MKFRMSLAVMVLLLATGGCDSGVPWRNEPYELLWIDIPDDVMLAYDLGKGASTPLVEPRVFAVGANDEYVVVQQHPRGDKTITNFFIIEVRTGAKPDGLPRIVGPMNEKEYTDRAASMSLPTFSKTLESLR